MTKCAAQRSFHHVYNEPIPAGRKGHHKHWNELGGPRRVGVCSQTRILTTRGRGEPPGFHEARDRQGRLLSRPSGILQRTDRLPGLDEHRRRRGTRSLTPPDEAGVIATSASAPPVSSKAGVSGMVTDVLARPQERK